MSDLISRSEAVQRIIQETVDGKYNLIHINTVKRLLQDVDTAYDIDKVVKELETNKQNALEVEESIKEYNVWNKAIEIVKQGGVGTEAETIRNKAVKWNNNSSKKVPYCGKKIKVVE